MSEVAHLYIYIQAFRQTLHYNANPPRSCGIEYVQPLAKVVLVLPFSKTGDLHAIFMVTFVFYLIIFIGLPDGIIVQK